MKIISSPKQMQNICTRLKKQNKTIGFVPTMGCLHDGHLSLIDIARKQADVMIASIFVNPTQFGKNEDFSRYPHEEKSDLKKLKSRGVHYVFLPKASDIYPQSFETRVQAGTLSIGLCGQSRPGHFDGVTTIVLKLFNIIQPTLAVFGKKDFQQFRIIEKLTTDFNLPIKIIGATIVREKDGLAMSSRNRYLSAQDRERALCLSKGLQLVRNACLQKSLTSLEIRKIFLKNFSKTMRLDYLEVCDSGNLKPLKKHQKGRTLIAVAAFIGNTRLIDNCIC